MHAVMFREAPGQVVSMLLHSFWQVICYSGIQGAVGFIRKYIDVVGFAHLFILESGD